jgi:NADPH:quinone reductase
MLALYGEASGLVPPIDPRELLLRKSLFLTRAGLDHYIADRAELRSRTDEIFSWIAQGRLKQKIFGKYRLEAAATCTG